MRLNNKFDRAGTTAAGLHGKPLHLPRIPSRTKQNKFIDMTFETLLVCGQRFSRRNHISTTKIQPMGLELTLSED